VPTPHFMALARDLVTSPSAPARAVGIEMLSHRGAIPANGLTARLEEESPLVLAAAIRGLGTHAELAALPEPIFAHLGSSHAAVAWEAARAVTLWGHPRAHDELSRESSLRTLLGPRALEIFVMLGEAVDMPVLQEIVARSPPTEPLLRAIGRFGHPTSWSFLVHFLSDEVLGPAALEALETLFGSRVPPRERTNPGAWRDALAQADLSPEVRYRRGHPWTPATVAAECVSGELSAIEIGGRADELRARVGARAAPDLARWTIDTRPLLGDWAGQAAKHGRRFRAGSWERALQN